MKLACCAACALALSLTGCGSMQRPSTQPSTTQAASVSPYLPANVSREIVAYFGKTYVPAWLPHGYDFARWSPSAGTYSALGEYLNIDFGDHGKLLEWSVGNPADPEEYSHGDCGKHPFGHVSRIQGKRIVYAGGAVGQTAILCISKNKAITVWNGYSIRRRALERIAASATSTG